MTLTFEFDLDWSRWTSKPNIVWKLLSAETHTHTWPSAIPGPLKRSVKITGQEDSIDNLHLRFNTMKHTHIRLYKINNKIQLKYR